MRRWYLIPLCLVALLVVALPVAALTETRLEQDLREKLGLETRDCQPMTDLASPWSSRASLPYKLDEPRGVGIGEQIYMLGGITGLEALDSGRLLLDPSNELTRFDSDEETYTSLAPMPRRLNHIGVVAYRGDVYVLGGYGRTLDRHTSKAFYRYDPDTDHWSRMPDMPEPRAAMAVGVIGHTLVVAGGARDDVPLADAFAFDFRGGHWSRLPSMLDRREHVGATALGGKLYVLGGRSKESFAARTAESFDLEKRRWERLPPMPVGSGGLGAVAVDGRVFAIGGGDDGSGTVTGAVQEWDPRTRQWNLLSGMRTPRHGDEVVSVGDSIWVLGGSPCAYFDATDSVESVEIDDVGEGQ
jgi:N-acetylneuraminic acid mutarotase